MTEHYSSAAEQEKTLLLSNIQRSIERIEHAAGFATSRSLQNYQGKLMRLSNEVLRGSISYGAAKKKWSEIDDDSQQVISIMQYVAKQADPSIPWYKKLF